MIWEMQEGGKLWENGLRIYYFLPVGYFPKEACASGKYTLSTFVRLLFTSHNMLFQISSDIKKTPLDAIQILLHTLLHFNSLLRSCTLDPILYFREAGQTPGYSHLCLLACVSSPVMPSASFCII